MLHHTTYAARINNMPLEVMLGTFIILGFTHDWTQWAMHGCSKGSTDEKLGLSLSWLLYKDTYTSSSAPCIVGIAVCRCCT